MADSIRHDIIDTKLLLYFSNQFPTTFLSPWHAGFHAR